MSRDRQAEAARRNARARAAGFSSYGQQYRAKRAGIATAGQYQAAVKARRSAGLARAVATGRIAGAVTTRTGAVIAADHQRGQASAQWAALSRYKDGRHVDLLIELDDGRVLHPGGRGGFRMGYLRSVVKSERTWRSAVVAIATDHLERDYDDDGADIEVTVVTATVL